MNLTRSLVFGALLVGISVGPALAETSVFGQWQTPEFNPATTYRLDEAQNDVTHYPSCLGLMNGTAHHSCGSLSGGPAGGLW